MTPEVRSLMLRLIAAAQDGWGHRKKVRGECGGCDAIIDAQHLLLTTQLEAEGYIRQCPGCALCMGGPGCRNQPVESASPADRKATAPANSDAAR